MCVCVWGVCEEGSGRVREGTGGEMGGEKEREEMEGGEKGGREVGHGGMGGLRRRMGGCKRVRQIQGEGGRKRRRKRGEPRRV